MNDIGFRLRSCRMVQHQRGSQRLHLAISLERRPTPCCVHRPASLTSWRCRSCAHGWPSAPRHNRPLRQQRQTGRAGWSTLHPRPPDRAALLIFRLPVRAGRAPRPTLPPMWLADRAAPRPTAPCRYLRCPCHDPLPAIPCPPTLRTRRRSLIPRGDARVLLGGHSQWQSAGEPDVSHVPAAVTITLHG